MTEDSEEPHRNWGTEITICQILDLISRSGKLPSGNGIQDTLQHCLATVTAVLWHSIAQVTPQLSTRALALFAGDASSSLLHRDHFCSIMRTSNSNVTECLQVCDFSHSNVVHGLSARKKKKKVLKSWWKDISPPVAKTTTGDIYFICITTTENTVTRI